MIRRKKLIALACITVLLGLLLNFVHSIVLSRAMREHPQQAREVDYLQAFSKLAPGSHPLGTADFVLPSPRSPVEFAQASTSSKQIARGEYVSISANCIACHTVPGQKPYAGGRALATKFGTFYPPNITPDKATGLGNWQADDLWRALRDGKGRDGRLLYPVFPYQHYSLMSRQDSDDLFAYLQSLPAVQQANRPHELAWPYRWQFSLAVWRLLYFDAPETLPMPELNPARLQQLFPVQSEAEMLKPFQFMKDATSVANVKLHISQLQARKQSELLRGAYLVNGPGHCAACHTTRDSLGGLNGLPLGGGQIPQLEWYAPSLRSAQFAAKWQEQDLAAYLSSGQGKQHAAFGPMADIIYQSLQAMSQDDVAAISSYLLALAELPKAEVRASSGDSALSGDSAMQSGKLSEKPSASLQLGGKLYRQHCQDCHQANGAGVSGIYPSLRNLNPSQQANAIRLILHGGFAPATQTNPRPYGMPAFGPELSDAEVAAVLNYAYASFAMASGESKGKNQDENQDEVQARSVAKYRAVPME